MAADQPFTIEPQQVEFGDVRVGDDLSKSLTIVNTHSSKDLHFVLTVPLLQQPKRAVTALKYVALLLCPAVSFLDSSRFMQSIDMICLRPVFVQHGR